MVTPPHRPAIQAMTGVGLVLAATLVAEIGDFSRFRHAASPHGLSGHRAGRALERCPDQAARHYQYRQLCRKVPTVRRRVELPDYAEGRPVAARPSARGRLGLQGHRLEGPAAPARPLQEAARPRQVQQRGDRCRCARAGRLHLGHRPPRRSNRGLIAKERNLLEVQRPKTKREHPPLLFPGRIPARLVGDSRCPVPASKRLQNLAIDGGADRDRTDDLLLAKQALSQLSYGPR